jgi:hypothetical protein
MDDRLTKRVDAIERELARRDEQPNAVIDESGRQWRFRDFLNMGLTRRQAMSVVASLAAGATLGAALSDAVVAQPTGDEGQVGTQANPVELWASEIDATEVATDKASVTQVVGRAELTSSQTINTGTITQMNLDQQDIEDSDILTVDLQNNKITITQDGTYMVKGRATWAGSANWTSGDRLLSRVSDDTNNVQKDEDDNSHHGENERFGQLSQAVYEISGDTDFIVEVFHDRGGDESLASSPGRTNLEVMRMG